MRKSVFGLAVAGATLAGAIGYASPTGAVNYVYNNVTYDVTTYTGSYNTLQSTLTAGKNDLWGNAPLSKGLSDVVADSFGLPNNDLFGRHVGPYFAFNMEAVPTSYDFVEAYAYPNVSYALGLNTVGTFATATAVPWETDALPVIGSTILFAGGLWARNKFAKPLQK